MVSWAKVSISPLCPASWNDMMSTMKPVRILVVGKAFTKRGYQVGFEKIEDGFYNSILHGIDILQ